MGRLLDAYDKLQAMPFGQWTANKSDPGLRQMNSQRATITSALRKGIRNARKAGDAAKVIAGINTANAYGVAATGVDNYDSRQAGSQVFADQTRKQSDINADLANRAAAGVDKIGGAPQQEIPSTGDAGGEVNPSQETASPGAKFAETATREPAPRLSLDEQAKAAARQSTMSGALGTGARDKLRRKEANKLVEDNTQLDGEGALTNTKLDALVPQIESMGGTRSSFLDAVRRQEDKLKRKVKR
jgi:hypothetical protein